MVHYIDTPGNQAGTFVAGNPFLAIPSTVMGAKWANMVQAELGAILVALGIPLDDTSNVQVLAALLLAYGPGVWSFTADEDLTALQPYLQGASFGVVRTTVTTGMTAQLLLQGLHLAQPKQTGGAWAKGQALYFDNTLKVYSTSATSGFFGPVGFAAAAAVSGASLGQVWLRGGGVVLALP